MLNLIPTHTTLYRIIRGDQASVADFIPDGVRRDKKPRPAQRVEPLTWAGVSTYARPEDAAIESRLWNLGSVLAVLAIPDERLVLVRRTLPHKYEHYSVLGHPEVLLLMVERLLPINDLQV